jgi:hypothetical protein
MSFLLDALRKSENRKHLGDVPTIHSTQSGESGLASKRGKGPVILVLLPAFLVLVWVGSRQFTMTEETRIEAAGQSVQPTAEPASRRLQSRDAQTSTQGAAETTGKDLSTASGPRTPVEDFAVQTEAPTPEQVPQLPDAGKSGGPVVVQVDETSLPEISSDPDTETFETVPFQPQLDGTISYWQLPQSVRSDLPEFRISVLVYAERPEDRFLLLNGKRQVEGDSYQSGLVLEEIRREGAVFSFRRYRFLVSQ